MCWDDFSYHNPSKYVELNHSNGEFWQLTAEQSDSEISNSGHRHPNPCIPQLLDYENQVKKSFQITKLNFRKSAAILLMKFDISWFVRTKIVAHFSQFDSRYSKLFFTWFYTFFTPDFKGFAPLPLKLGISLSLCSQQKSMVFLGI